ncbi:MAG TPA: ECF-type sigma factor [Xanthomonadales bacterium]|nr:ECF-type sigma factor [Xanthomonadales bacterium]
MAELTELLGRARDGDKSASDRLFAAVYEDLRRIAARNLRGAGDGMRTTSLVHEAYEKLARPEALDLNDRRHFFAVAARAMRQIVIDHARERAAGKRGGALVRVTFDGASEEAPSREGMDELVALDAALGKLEALDPRLARLVELRFFGGMNLEEAGEAIGLSPTTLKRDWRRARAFLHGALAEQKAAKPGQS